MRVVLDWICSRSSATRFSSFLRRISLQRKSRKDTMTQTVDMIIAEMEARMQELEPLVAEAAQLEQILEAMGEPVLGRVPHVPTGIEKLATKPVKSSRRKYRGRHTTKERYPFVVEYLRTQQAVGFRDLKGTSLRAEFTFGSLMDAMTRRNYAGMTWNRTSWNMLAELQRNGILVFRREIKSARNRKYYAVEKDLNNL